MDCLKLYVLTRLSVDVNGRVLSGNIGVTFDLYEAETHRARGIENDFEMFVVESDWREDAEQSNLVRTMRDLCAIVRQMQEESLR